jgi:transposase InsO family protein
MAGLSATEEPDAAPRYVIRDRDSIYGEKLFGTLRALDIEQKVISCQSPWQNGYVERVIGSMRRECLDHVVVFGERPELTRLSSPCSAEEDAAFCLRLQYCRRSHLSAFVFLPNAPAARPVSAPAYATWPLMPR